MDRKHLRGKHEVTKYREERRKKEAGKGGGGGREGGGGRGVLGGREAEDSRTPAKHSHTFLSGCLFSGSSVE